jgi:hypothetical protein
MTRAFPRALEAPAQPGPIGTFFTRGTRPAFAGACVEQPAGAARPAIAAAGGRVLVEATTSSGTHRDADPGVVR